MICLASVVHSGTRFMQQSVLRDFHFLDSGGVSRHACHHHIAPDQLGRIQGWAAKGYVLVVPLRHPVSIFESWSRRGEDLSALDEQFGILENHVAPLGPYYVAIDHAERDRQLEVLSDRIGVELSTDWAPVGHEVGSRSASPECRELAEFWLSREPWRGFYE